MASGNWNLQGEGIAHITQQGRERRVWGRKEEEGQRVVIPGQQAQALGTRPHSTIDWQRTRSCRLGSTGAGRGAKREGACSERGALQQQHHDTQTVGPASGSTTDGRESN